MLNQTINLIRQATLTTYIHDQSANGKGQIPLRPALIILPGGAYSFLSDTEAEPVALTFMEAGFNTFVLRYSVKEASVFPNPLEEISLAVWTVRQRAAEWQINPDAIVAVGFSAGACIAGMLSSQWEDENLLRRLGIPPEGNKPNAVVMAYGATSNQRLLATAEVIPEDLGKIARDRTPELELINYVNEKTAPTFLWQTRYDQNVPAEQALQYAQKLFDYQIPYELHIFQGGRHGLSVNNSLSSYKDKEQEKTKNVSFWVPMCINWLYSLFDL
ncbi:alpha/beta hydrolase [Enterococcus sp. HY326]|uniref:alpha/beta hydrolase n=1 Tax=Enterococcus sp. HY326 TaxID=2971265 RepID=UPI00223F3C2A|nr:alpha/beta hydrolase [Enterococcus sp. HY326]